MTAMLGAMTSGRQTLLRLSEGAIRIEALIGQRQVQAAAAEVDALRVVSDQFDEPLSSTQHFLSRAEFYRELPVALMMYEAGRLFGVVFLQVRRRLRVPVGFVRSGNLMGQGSVVAAQADQVLVAETASRALLRFPLVHTAILSLLFPGQTVAGPIRRVTSGNARWHYREVRLRLDLSGGLEATMERLGYKMRRNLRSFRRKAEQARGCRLIPDLSDAQRLQAVEALCNQGRYPTEFKRARDWDTMLRATQGNFAMGLVDEAGTWLSYVAGWRGPLGTYIDWQLNGSAGDGVSVSTLMRGYLLEHEIGRRSPAIIFVGGTSPLWSRACDPIVCGDLLATRKGWTGWAVRTFVSRFRPAGQVASLHRQSSVHHAAREPVATPLERV